MSVLGSGLELLALRLDRCSPKRSRMYIRPPPLYHPCCRGTMRKRNPEYRVRDLFAVNGAATNHVEPTTGQSLPSKFLSSGCTRRRQERLENRAYPTVSQRGCSRHADRVKSIDRKQSCFHYTSHFIRSACRDPGPRRGCGIPVRFQTGKAVPLRLAKITSNFPSAQRGQKVPFLRNIFIWRTLSDKIIAKPTQAA